MTKNLNFILKYDFPQLEMKENNLNNVYHHVHDTQSKPKGYCTCVSLRVELVTCHVVSVGKSNYNVKLSTNLTKHIIHNVG